MFHTPPINGSIMESAPQAIRESYQIQMGGSSPELSNTSSNGNVILTKEEIASEVGQITELPAELARLVDNFIDDLKQPKYLKPLSVLQLSSLFQNFYMKFDKAAFQYLNRPQDATGTTFLYARETLSSGISGIFNRSRSSSDTARKRSSSLFSTDSANGPQPMLTPDEINRHIRINELNNYKIDKLLELCEHDTFKKILAVGTSVPGNSFRMEKSQKGLKATNLFKNSPEFLEFDRAVWDKTLVISNMSANGKLDLKTFLSVPRQNLDTAHLMSYLEKMVNGPLAPYEKLLNVINLHDEMTRTLQHLSNDDFLSTLIYLTIHTPIKHMFLNLQFIKFFRYNKKLIEKDLYALTNLEAALTFIEGLTLTSLPSEVEVQLSNDESSALQMPISHKIALPELHVTANDSNQHYSGLPRSNSYKEFEGLKTAFDSSLRNIFGKIRSYTPPTGAQQSGLNPDKVANGPENLLTQADGDTAKKIISIPDSWRTLGNREFEQLKVSELKQIFENYQKLLDALDNR
ncbi:LADA_0D04720g1_1 [Lachancea dasiensis]|uniref:LADA_0D04720g1_1 n=1 Tax=Lachancea dasiensis TaxID=1072105 RepID=A0A1G4J5H2_9SACH|nr:LADA_0D04720g1_1 [Lachancea dasiensis]